MQSQTVKISSTSGKNIAVAIHTPDSTSSSLVILCPGNLDSKDYPHLVKLAESLCERGYTAVRLDPIGTWESDGDDADYLVSEYISNVKSVLDHMLKQKAFTEILVGGHSRGGAVSIFSAARDSRITKVLAIMPPYPVTPEELQKEKYVKWEATGFNLSVRDIPGSTETRKYNLPYSHLIDRIKFNVMDDVKKVQVPFICVAAELDTECRPEDVREIFDAANEPKKFILIKGMGHGYRRNPQEIEAVNEEILKVLK